MARPIARKKAKNKTINLKKRKKVPRVILGTGKAMIREEWDLKKTVKENYENLGIARTLEQIKENDVVKEKKNTEFVETLIKEVDDAKKAPKNVKQCSRNEEVFLTKLLRKYGHNYAKMAYDEELNMFQLTPGVLKRKIWMLESNSKSCCNQEGC